MLELIVYDDSKKNNWRNGTMHHPTKFENTKKFRIALDYLKFSHPFLIRKVMGDYFMSETRWFERFVHPNHNYKCVAKPTFDGRDLSFLLQQILAHGHDRYAREYSSEYDDEISFGRDFIYRTFIRKFGFKPKINDLLWAMSYNQVQEAGIYEYLDEWAMFPEERNTISLILNPSLYENVTNFLYFQQDIELRRKALQGIILSEVSPNRRSLPTLQFDLNQENLVLIMQEIRRTGYSF